MKTRKTQWAARAALALLLGAALAVVATGPTAAQPCAQPCATPCAAGSDEACCDPGGARTGFWYGGELTTTFHYTNTAYFGADYGITDDPRKTDYNWQEGYLRLRVNYGLTNGLWFSLGGLGALTLGTDYYGVDQTGDAKVDQMLVGLTHMGNSGLSFVAGRQEIVVGDGFLIGDGYNDDKAALWNIPLSFYDGVRADWKKGPWHALAFGANLSSSYSIEVEDPAAPGGVTALEPDGLQWGFDVGGENEVGQALALGHFRRDDRGATRLDVQATSARFTLPYSVFKLAGEYVLERGTTGDTELEGIGAHVSLTAASESGFSPYGQVEYFYFSGDRGETSADESYYPWNFRWSDWSRYYVGDLVASTLVTNTDSRIWKLEGGVTPWENTSFRLLLHQIDLDTGSSYGGLPEGVGRGFANEYDLVVDQGLGGGWSAWLMGGYVVPRDAAKALVGTAKSGQIFAGLTYGFGVQDGEEDE
jgi:hypothetical protein